MYPQAAAFTEAYEHPFDLSFFLSQIEEVDNTTICYSSSSLLTLNPILTSA